MALMTNGNLAVTGIQFGDEGKGQVVDALSRHFDYVVRFNGGANAGHSVWIGDTKHALHLVPSGILRPHTTNVIANGVVVDPWSLLDEVDELREAGVDITPESLLLSDRCHLVMPYHKIEDGIIDSVMSTDASSGDLIETTKRGIGPCYADKSYRATALRAVDLLDRDHLRDVVPRIVRVKNATLSALAQTAGVEFSPFDPQRIIEDLSRCAERLAPHIRDVQTHLRSALASRKRLLFEGANATLLDVDFGTYPYVTSSTCSALGVYSGTGLSTDALDTTIGVAKLYMSRVGTGPFPTELFGAEADRIRNAAGEFGTTTGRPRRIGSLDLVALRHAVRLNGTTALALTGLAYLSGLSKIKVCTAYRIGNDVLDVLPASPRLLAQAQPVYQELAGFDADVGAVRSLADLPEGAKDLVQFVEESVRVPVGAVCVGKEREQLLIKD
jgi:adenylosuccinate synthase